MPSLDIFNDDAFSAVSLTNAINTSPEGQRVPALLDALFEEESVNTTSVFIERENDSLALVPAGERGAPAEVTTGAQRDVIPFKTLHLPTRSTIRADEVQGIRAFGTESELETVMELVGKRLAKQRKRLEATIRFQRAGAITGKIYDADGQRLLLDLHRQFGIGQQSHAMALGSDATKVLGKIVEAKRKAEDAIADSGIITGWLAVCGRGIDVIIEHNLQRLGPEGLFVAAAVGITVEHGGPVRHRAGRNLRGRQQALSRRGDRQRRRTDGDRRLHGGPMTNPLGESRQALVQRLSTIAVANGYRADAGANVKTGWFNEVLQREKVGFPLIVVQKAKNLDPVPGPRAFKVAAGYYVIGAVDVGLDDYEGALDDLELDLHSSPVTLVEGTHYEIVSLAGGIVKVISPASLTQSFEAAYSYAAADSLAIFANSTPPERWIFFGGINTVTGDKVILDLYRVQFDPVSDFGRMTQRQILLHYDCALRRERRMRAERYGMAGGKEAQALVRQLAG